MKNLFSFFSLFLLISFTSCSDESSTSEKSSGNLITKSTSGSDVDPGELHNDIVRKYEAYKDANGAITDFDAVVAFVDDELKASGSPITLTQVLDQDPVFREKLFEVVNAGADIAKINSIFNDMYVDKISTYEQYTYAVDLMNKIDDNEGDVSTYYNAIASFESQVQNDSQMDSSLQKALLQTGSIASGSHYFWYEEPGNPNLSQTQQALRNESKIVRIAGADTAGALAGIQSGAVAAASVFGGWGGLVALVGCAAVSSIMAS